MNRSAKSREIAISAAKDGIPAPTRENMRISTLDGLFAVQYTTLTSGAFLTAFLLSLGASTFQVGIVASLTLVGGMLQPLGAEVIRRSGGKRKGVCLTAALVDVLLWSATIMAVLELERSTAIGLVLGVLAMQQAASAFVGVAWTSWISDLIPPRLRGRYFGTRNFVCNFFGAVTAVAAGVVVRSVQGDPIPVYLSLFGLGMVFRLISISFLYRQTEPFPSKNPAGGFLKQLAQPISNRGYRRYLTFSAAWGFSVQLSSPFFAVYMLQEAGVGVAAVMLFAALATAANLMGQRVWGPICDRFGDKQVMRVAGLTAAFQPFWWLFTGASGFGYFLMPLLNMTGGFAWGGFTLATGNLMMRLAPETGKNSYFAVQAALGGVFGAAGPLVGGLLAAGFAGGMSLIPAFPWMGGLKSLFFTSFVLRFVCLLLLQRVPEPVQRPRLRAIFVIRDTVRTLNPTQGFSPMLHPFLPSGRERTVRRRALKAGRS